MTTPRCIFLLTIALSALPALAGTPKAAQTRAVTPQESAAFDQFYQASHAAAGAAPAVFFVTRAHGRRRWDISASVDAAPQRSSATLCRMVRYHYTYDGQAARDQRWRAAPEPEQFAWSSAAVCSVPAQPVLLMQPVADAELTALLQQQTTLLARARLLLAGNTDCAWQRSFAFTLAAVDTAPAVPGKISMRGLRFHSDRDSSATVWVRKSGADLTAWSATCSKSDTAKG